MVISIFELGITIFNTKLEMAEFDPFERYDESVIVNPAYEDPYQGQGGGGYNDTVSTVGSQENTAWLRQEVNAYYEEIMKGMGSPQAALITIISLKIVMEGLLSRC